MCMAYIIMTVVCVISSFKHVNSVKSVVQVQRVVGVKQSSTAAMSCADSMGDLDH